MKSWSVLSAIRDLPLALSFAAIVATPLFKRSQLPCRWLRLTERGPSHGRSIARDAVKAIQPELVSADAAVFLSAHPHLSGSSHGQSRCCANIVAQAIPRQRGFVAAAEKRLTLEQWNGFQ
jgi:hypothetical protein